MTTVPAARPAARRRAWRPRWRSVAGAILAAAMLIGLGFVLASGEVPLLGGPTPSPSAGGYVAPSATPWLVSIAPGQVQMPAGADCGACHVTTGGVVGIRDIPVIPHPVAQWRTCTACHDNARLVQTAPGHSGIHADQCLVCHTQSTGAAPPPAHATQPNADCLSCHGVTAPIPADMAHKPRNLCWLCHLSPSPGPS